MHTASIKVSLKDAYERQSVRPADKGSSCKGSSCVGRIRADGCVDRLNAEGGRDSASWLIHLFFFSKMPQVRTMRTTQACLA